MSHIYIHIPFCHKACYYCNFHFQASKKYIPQYIEALLNEIELSQQYLYSDGLNKCDIETLYFGGGTPSVLSYRDIERIMNALSKYHSFSQDAEITFEANPDDLTPEYLENLKKAGINRLSIGIQSFRNEDLILLNRSHDANTAFKAIYNAQESGFDNLNIDLIFAIPNLSLIDWERNLETFLKYNIPHLSAYNLTIEPQTPLFVYQKQNKFMAMEDGLATEQYRLLCQIMGSNKYEHYEISNFARKGFISRHNSSYWKGETYLGLGASAHSYNLQSRQWNIANNSEYIRSISSGIIPFEKETLNLDQKYNEYVMTSLRTAWGAHSTIIEQNFGLHYRKYFEEQISKYTINGMVSIHEGVYVLTLSGKFIADAISADCFI